MGFCASLTECRQKEAIKAEFVAKYGTLFESIQLKKAVWKRKFNTVFIIRRFLYALLIIILHAYPWVQYIALFIVAIIPVLKFMIVE
jgi:hypothetical protein